MEALAALVLFLAVVIALAVPLVGLVTGVLALLSSRRLDGRLAHLERLLDERGAGAPASTPLPSPEAPAPPGAAPPSPEPPALPPPEAPAPPGAAPSSPEPPALPVANSWGPEKVAVWVASIMGGFMVLLGGLFALAAAMDRGWLGPSVRVSLGLAGGMGLWLASAAARRRGYRVPGSAGSGAALGMIFGALYAATGRYGLLSPALAFGLMAAVTAVAMGSAARERDRFMAHLGLLGGLLTPILVNSGQNNPVALFGYLALLLAGSMVASLRRGWWDLALSGLVGSAAIYIGWTVAWRAPDQVPAGVLAAFVLSLPPLAVALSRRSTGAVGLVARGGLLVFPLLGLAWLLPVDPLFVDPRTGLELMRPLGAAPCWAAGGLALLMVPAAAAARGLANRWALLATSLVLGALAVAFAAGWAHVGSGMPAGLACLAILAPLALLIIARLGRRRGGEGGLSPLPALLGLAMAVSLSGPSPEPTTVLGVGGLALLGVILAFISSNALILTGLLVGVTAPLLVAGERLQHIGLEAVAASVVLVYATLATLPLLVRWRAHPGHGPLVAALAAPALFLPVYRCWLAGLGDAVVGALPILMGTLALVGAAYLLRVHGAHRRSASLALLVGVALAGVTAAVPVQLEDQWLTIAWALEAAALAFLTRHLTHPLLKWSAAALGMAVAVRLVLNPWALEYGAVHGPPILNWTLYTWGVPMVALLAAGRWSAPRGRSLEGLEAWLPRLLRGAAIAVGFMLVEVQVRQVFPSPATGAAGLVESMTRSLAWAGYGVILLVTGMARASRALRFVGFAVVLLATTKVFALDLWALEGFVRVGSVLGLGASLLLAAFLFERAVLRAGEES